jgi:hypothetical protein
MGPLGNTVSLCDCWRSAWAGHFKSPGGVLQSRGMGLRLGPVIAVARVQGKPGSASLSRGTTRRLLCQCCRRPPDSERPGPAGRPPASSKPGPRRLGARRGGPGPATASCGLPRRAGARARVGRALPGTAVTARRGARGRGILARYPGQWCSLPLSRGRGPAWSLRRWPTMAPQAAGQPESEATGTGSCHLGGSLFGTTSRVVPAGGRPPQTAGVTPSRI